MLEEWMHSPQVLATFAHHYQTGTRIPADMIARMNRVDAFGRGGFVALQNAYAAIFYDLHKSKPEGVNPDAVAFDDIELYAPAVPVPSEAHLYASFPHLADPDYCSSYYAYMWDLVIAQDFFRQFDKKNLLAGETAMR